MVLDVLAEGEKGVGERKSHQAGDNIGQEVGVSIGNGVLNFQ